MDIHEETHCTTRKKLEMMQMFFLSQNAVEKKRKQEAQGIWHFALQDGRQWRHKNR